MLAPVPLASPSDDPRVQEGLRQILQLDERLMKKSAQAALVARETFPEAWEAQDRKQAERDEKQLLQSLERCCRVLPQCSTDMTGSDHRSSWTQLVTAVVFFHSVKLSRALIL